MAGTGKSLSELERSYYATYLKADFSVDLGSDASTDEIKRDYFTRHLITTGRTNLERTNLAQLEREFLINRVNATGTPNPNLKYESQIWNELCVAFGIPTAKSIDERKRHFYATAGSML